jgi:hypothetical protein
VIKVELESGILTSIQNQYKFTKETKDDAAISIFWTKNEGACLLWL